MAKTLIGVYDSWAAAENTANVLQASGFKGSGIHIMPGSRFLDELRSKEEGGFLANLKKKLGFGTEEYSPSNIRADDTVLMVEAPDDSSADVAADILNRGGAADIDTRMLAGKKPAAPETTAKPMGAATGEQKIPVVEEELQVGKRAVKHGGVRIYSHATERPVEEEVALRKERVHVERRPTDRPVSEAEMGGFKEGTVDVTATSEEPMIGKKARVKEEVVVSKETGEATERVRETLRGTEVEVEELSPEEEREFVGYEDELRAEAGGPGPGYDELRRYYRYGYHMGHDKYHDGNWSDIEPKIREDWEAHHYGPWDRYKGAVRSGWERGAHAR